MILLSFRDTAAADAEIFAKAAAAVMTGYSEEIVREAFNPRSGLQTRQKWLPTLSEIRDACERAAGELANRERRRLLNEHRVLIDTPRGPQTEPNAERLRIGGAASSATDQLRIAGPTADDDSRTYSQAEWIERALGWLYTAMATADRESGAVRKPGTTRARVDLGEIIKNRLGDQPERVRSLCKFFAAHPEVYHEVVEARRLDNGVTGAAWSLLCQRLHEYHAGIDVPQPAPRPQQAHQKTASPEARERVAAYWEKLRPTFKEPAHQRKNEPPPGLTDEQKRKWYAERLEERLSDIKAHNESEPVVIGEELARKIAAIRADYEYPLQAAE